MPRTPLAVPVSLISSRNLSRSSRFYTTSFITSSRKLTSCLSPPLRRLPHQTKPRSLTSHPYLTQAVREHQARKTTMAPQLDGYFKQVDDLSDQFIERLRQAVAIPSISSEAARRPDVVRMGHWLAEELTKLGAESELRPLGK